MAEKKKKLTPEQENHRICDEFNHSMFALLTDYLDIAPEKSKEIYDLVDKVKSKTKKENEKYDRYKDYIDKSKKFSQFQYAMFNFMNSIFERSMNDLLKFAIRSKKDIKNIFIKKFIDYEDKQDKKIRDANYENLTNKQRLAFQLNYYEQIITLKPDNWQFLLNIPNEIMWASKKLKFEYTELRARRHLLTHRGYSFDKKYVEDIKNTIKKSKNSDDPKKLFELFHRNKYFTNTRDELDVLDDLAKPKPYRVFMTRFYFINAFTCLFRFFHMVQCYLSSSEVGFTSSAQVKFLNAAVKYEDPYLMNFSKILCNDLVKIDKKKMHNYEMCNYLIGCIEIRNVLNKMKKDYKKTKYEEEYLNCIIENNDPLIKFLVAYYHEDKSKYKQLLEKIEDSSLGADAINWPIFNGIRNNKALMKILKTKIKIKTKS